jgi:uncharacterized protein YdeI (YjbR/CyaY-like superfamily)
MSMAIINPKLNEQTRYQKNALCLGIAEQNPLFFQKQAILADDCHMMTIQTAPHSTCDFCKPSVN